MNGGGKRLNDVVGRMALAVTLVVMLGALYLSLIWAPTDRELGAIQRLFYMHLPFAFVAFVAFFVVFGASIMWLIRPRPFWDALAVASAELGLLFCTLVLLSGSLFAKPTWGTWWTWDPRLTTTLILWLIYVAYHMLRAALGDPAQRARLAAVVGIVGFVDVPIVFFSIRWWRTIHPLIISEQGMALDPAMTLTLAVSAVAWLLVFSYLCWLRVRLEQSRNALDRIVDDLVDREEYA